MTQQTLCCKSPWPNDTLLGFSIQRVNLDLLWSREPPIICSNLTKIKKLLDIPITLDIQGFELHRCCQGRTLYHEHRLELFLFHCNWQTFVMCMWKFIFGTTQFFFGTNDDFVPGRPFPYAFYFLVSLCETVSKWVLHLVMSNGQPALVLILWKSH